MAQYTMFEEANNVGQMLSVVYSGVHVLWPRLLILLLRSLWYRGSKFAEGHAESADQVPLCQRDS